MLPNQHEPKEALHLFDFRHLNLVTGGYALWWQERPPLGDSGRITLPYFSVALRRWPAIIRSMDKIDRYYVSAVWREIQRTGSPRLVGVRGIVWFACIFFVAIFSLPAAEQPTNAIPATGVLLTPLPLMLPLPSLGPGPWPPEGLGYVGQTPPPHLEDLPSNRRPAFLAPKGITNMALGKKVTCSVGKIRQGILAQITDGKKEAYDEQAVEFRGGLQWVQVDLEQDCSVYAILLWHDFRRAQVFHDVIVQASDQPEFKSSVRTLFNNDRDNSSGLGVGADKEYFENHEGKLIDTKGTKTRYLRFYSNGNNNESSNAYQEIEVYALPGR